MNDAEEKTHPDRLDQEAAKHKAASEQSGLHAEETSKPRVIHRKRKEPPPPDSPDYGAWTETTIASHPDEKPNKDN